jgi:hypothetical protein
MLDVAGARAEIERFLAETYPGVEHGAVLCPAEIPIAQGTTFDCRAPIGDGKTLHFTVTQDAADGSSVSFAPTEAVLESSKVGADVTGQVAGQFIGDEILVDCGPDIVRVIAPGGTFECAGIDEFGTQKQIRVTVADISGRFTIEVL